MREKSSPLGYYTIGIAALFLLGFLLLIVFGAQVYQDTVTGQDDNNRTRALRSYLVTCAASAAADDVTVEDTADGQMLCIRDSGTDYGLRVFLRDGKLWESYGRMDAAAGGDDAQPIAETSVFAVEKISDDVWAVTTDAGRSLLQVGKAESAPADADADAETTDGDAAEDTAAAQEKGGGIR